MILQDVYKITIVNGDGDHVIYKGTDLIHAEALICKLMKKGITIVVEVF